MLRRQPTAIKLTPEDVLLYDDEKVKKNSVVHRAGANQNVLSGPLADRTKDERIGVRRP